MVVSVDGGVPREILSLPRNESFRQPEWSPDGQSVIASKVGPGGFAAGLEIWRIPIGGGSPQKLELGDITGEFRLHPDGRRITFTNGRLQREVWAIENFLPMLQAKR